MAECVCAGIIVADHVCAPVEHVPAPGELVLTPRMELSIGGCAANVAVDLAKLGRSAAIVGRVGRDIFGRFAREELARAGVDCEHLTESPERETAGSLVINARGEDRRFIHSTGSNAEFTGREVTAEILRGARVLYLGGYCLVDSMTPENVAAMFRAARDAGVITMLDVVIPKPGKYWSRLEPVLSHTDVFVPNEDEARIITGESDPLRQAEAFAAAGAGVVAITCGGAGCVLVRSGERLRAGSYRTEFIDGTGSGDAFAAGYIHGLLQGAAPRDCLRYGSALGASCVRATGATTAVFNVRELEDFVRSNELTIGPA